MSGTDAASIASDEMSARERAVSAAAAEIRALLPRSEALLQTAQAFVPGGFTRARFFWPMPIYIDRGDGPFVWDVDERRYIDCILGFGTMVLGHRPPSVLAAVERQLEKGTQFGTAVESESELAATIVENVPNAERVYFLNSGTEATLAALRIARAATGRTKVAKFEGGWHGWHDFLLHSFSEYGGTENQPETMPASLGISAATQEDVVTLPFNHPAAFELIRQHADGLACVIFEGIQGSAGCVVADSEWAQQLQRTCRDAGVLLICDEVITGFRLGRGGMAAKLGIEPDLTTLGKLIGGGFPVGAVTGRADLFELTQPDASGEQVLLAGTFSANPITMTAGKAQLDALLGDPDSFDFLDSLGDRMRTGLSKVISDTGVPGDVAGAGAIWGLHLGGGGSTVPHTPRNVRESNAFGVGSDDSGSVLTGYMLREGVLMEAPGHLCFVGTAHNEQLVDEVLDAYGRAFTKMMVDGIFS